MEKFTKEDFIMLACLAQMFLIIFNAMQLKGITL